jgi:hypothetical protein
MAMTGFEKRFVNRAGKGQKNIEKIQQRLEALCEKGIDEGIEPGCSSGSGRRLYMGNPQII